MLVGLAALAYSCAGAVSIFAADVGMVAPFVSTFCPAGWDQVDGHAVAVTTPLGALLNINKTWGAPSGAMVFTPNILGLFIRSRETGGGLSVRDSGRVFGSFQDDAFQGHYHNLYYEMGNFLAGGSSWGNPTTSNPKVTPIGGGAPVKEAVSNGTNGTPRTANETRPENIALLYCVKAYESTSTVQGSAMISTFTLVEISTTAQAQMNPGVWQYMTGGDISFWYGVILAGFVIAGYKMGRK